MTMDKYFTDRHNQRWTSDKEARLIGLYEENRLLWDSRHPDYRDKDKRERAMSAIAEGLQDEFDASKTLLIFVRPFELYCLWTYTSTVNVSPLGHNLPKEVGQNRDCSSASCPCQAIRSSTVTVIITVLNVKNKIKWLRDYFVKELKRELGLTVKTTSHQGTPSQGYVSRWEHFNKWAFLRSIFSADLCSPSTTNAPDSSQSDSSDVRPPIPNGECRGAEMAASTQDLSSNDARPQRPPAPPPEKNAAYVPVTAKAHVREPRAPSRSTTASAPAAFIVGTRRSEVRAPTPTNEKEHEDAVPAVRIPSAEEKREHDSPASDAETGPRNESGCATIGDVSVDSFSLYVVWQLRQMNQYQRDLAILRIRQQLFDAKYTVEPSIPVVGAATLLGGAGTSRHRQPASTTRDSRAACALRLPLPIRVGGVEIRGTKQTALGARPASA
ncbi:uncharacterized protein LOC142587403 isoform X2 [Dermacentor variabilis]|uniref:uncharacterized protein LOC142587403 isoform X2 n=1 Tax=Dermacentor variabilis TaxID=34621 RepID=UPI003F5C62E5